MSGYFYNGTNLDNIFKVRQTSKIANVGFSSEGNDISNRYEKSFTADDRYSLNVNFKNFDGTDLSQLFQRASYWKISASLSSSTETFNNYNWNNDGSITVVVQTRYLKLNQSTQTYNIKLTMWKPQYNAWPGTNIAGSTVTAFGSANASASTVSASFNGLNGNTTYTVYVQDTNSGLTGSANIYVRYNNNTASTASISVTVG